MEMSWFTGVMELVVPLFSWPGMKVENTVLWERVTKVLSGVEVAATSARDKIIATLSRSTVLQKVTGFQINLFIAFRQYNSPYLV